ncbi:MAG: hypothetical protein PWQ10_464 [Patescibacteria group bacterium]|nr:hypothetical protein [Patescibacteria group bacterium]
MNIFVKVTPAPKPKTNESQQIAYFYALILIVFALCQLFTFDSFLILLNSFGLPGGLATSNLLGGIIVISEISALPFLLQMRLSPLMRTISMGLGWLVSLIWFSLSLWLCLTTDVNLNIGFLGTVVDLIFGWWTVFTSISFGVMATWASWGMWPFVRLKKIT